LRKLVMTSGCLVRYSVLKISVINNLLREWTKNTKTFVSYWNLSFNVLKRTTILTILSTTKRRPFNVNTLFHNWIVFTFSI
jgi:hypothetical protein